MSATDSTSLPLSDIQGLLLHGYKGYDFIRHSIFRIDDDARVRDLCRLLLPNGKGLMSVTDSSQWPSEAAKPPYRLNLALTVTGLTKLITPANFTIVDRKTSEILDAYKKGAVMNAINVGDTPGGPNGPANWWPKPGWQLQTPPNLSTDFDLVLSVYAQNPAGRCSYHETLLSMIPPGAAVLTFQQDADPLPEGPEFIHFGYHDGISQPRIQSSPPAMPGASIPGAPRGAATSLAKAAPGDDPDDRPVVPSWHFIIDPSGDSTYNAHPFLVNGSFGAFRLLYQDVAAFEAFINTKGIDPELLAAKMCGRWRDGTPLEVSPDKPDPTLTGFDLTNFQYQNPSAHQKHTPLTPDTGQLCPYASHIRRANPRDDTSVHFNADGNAMAILHRILRRAQPYGPAYVSGDTKDRGLVGYFIGANLTQQFEFLMGTWITRGGFADNDKSANSSGFDPLFGSPTPPPPQGITSFEYVKNDTADPSQPANYTELDGLPQLVYTKGGLYVFFPSITAIGLMADGKIA